MLQGPNTPYTLLDIPEGSAGTLATLKLMRQLAIQGKQWPYIRQLALSLAQGLQSKDWYGEVSRIFYFVRDRIRYVRDINDIETLHTVDKILADGQGDCDDKSVLLAALLESIGHPARFVAVGKTINTFEHVYVETKIGDKWIALETTMPWDIGQAPQGFPARMVVNI